jgi:uracil-DNA glycosylase family 4
MGQNPGAEEELAGEPFVGAAGQALERQYMSQAGLTREDVSLGNALRCRWQRSNELPEVRSTLLKQAVAHCRRHWRVPEGTKYLVSMGDYALLSTAGEPSSSEWRGWLLPQRGTHARHRTSVWVPAPGEIPVFATAHPARIMREPSLRIPLLHDWRRVARLLRGRWPHPLPEIHTGPLASPITEPAVAFDTEFEGSTLTRYSLAWPGHIQVTEAGEGGVQADGTTRFIMQNAVADYQSLKELTGLTTPRYEDIMYAHAVLWAGFPHDLDYMSSLYASTNRWKHLAKAAPIVYSGADAWGTWEVWQALQQELGRDPLSAQVYRTQLHPLVPIIDRATRHGLRVNQARATQVASELSTQAKRAAVRAQAALGWTINLGSTKHLATQLYAIEGLTKRVKRHAPLPRQDRHPD